ncbi:MAG: hypothetical protein NC911_06035, partial [Candidatus Omnitrophica bacterium]|nr:hypothetical protein [Candidatus Omnitrophota bacterium]
LMKKYTSLQFKGTFDFTENVSLFFNLKKYYDFVYDVSGEYKNGSSTTATNTGNLWLREVFLDYKQEPLFIRAGRQQVVWGTADGVRILDCINPADNRYATLDDAAEYRIPLWMLRLELSPITDGNLQFLLIPDHEPNFNAGFGDVLVYRVANRPPPVLPPWVTYQIVDNLPADGFDDPDLAVRWQQVIAGWEYTLNYKYGREFYPSVTVRQIPFPPPVPPNPWTLSLTKNYQRVQVIGASFTKAVNTGRLAGLTIRGECTYTLDKPYPIGTDNNATGNTTQNTFAYVLGLDKYLFTDLQTSIQFVQFINPHSRVGANDILHPATLAPIKKVESLATIKLAKDFLNERLKPEVLAIWGCHGDWRVSPKVSYEVNDYLTVYTGVHYFAGRNNTLFGEFEQSSLVFAGANLAF